MAIPEDAKHPKNAAVFIDYFLRPEVSATLTNEMTYATANKAALEKVNPEIAQNKTVFVDAENMEKMVSPSSFSNEARESMSNVPTPCSRKASSRSPFRFRLRVLIQAVYHPSVMHSFFN